MALNVANAPLGTPLPLAFGRVIVTGEQIINQTNVLEEPQVSHDYSAGDVITDGTYQQLCIHGGTSGDSLPGSWNATPGGDTDWGSTTFANQGTTNGDGTQYGFWVLGEGEWDGFDTMFNIQSPLFIIARNYDITTGTFEPYGPGGGGVGLNPPDIHFHSGTDGAVGSALPTPGSSGPDQGCDAWISELPPGAAIIPQCYSRIAYYGMKWLPADLIGGAGDAQINQMGQTLAPIGHWRALHCRIFDDTGTQVGYQWTDNPAWHWVEAYLRCKFLLRSECQINMSAGPPYTSTPTPLPSEVKDKFDWGSIYEFAQDCDYTLAGGQKRFTGNYLFASQTPLAAIVEQILLCSRGYQQEYAGKLFLAMDKPRASVFTILQKHYVPRSLQVDQKEVHQNANDITYQFLDLLLPGVYEIATIDFLYPGPGDYTGGQATVATEAENAAAPWDVIEIGGCSDTDMDRLWQVNNIIDDFTFTCQPVDPTLTASSSGTGGLIGYPQSRFSKRACELWHLTHAVARGQIGP